MMKKNWLKYIGGFAAMLMIGLIIYGCSRNPVTGKKEVMLISKQQELAMGQQYDPQISAAYGVYKDNELQAFINEKGKQMGKISHRPELNYQFKIMDSPVVNAFAVPGGYIYFTRGIMAHFNNEAEFAGVLGHEIGHVTARHSAQQQTKATLAQVGLMAGIVAGGEQFLQFADAAQQGLGLLFLKFGRDDETQSDELGVEYSTKIGYDAREMADFFATLKRLSAQSGAGSIPTFMSTHPDPADRNRKVAALAQAWQQKAGRGTAYKINRDEYLRRIDGLVYGEDPRQGYVENNAFYHPELKFQFPTPSNWKVVNTPSQVQMVEPNGKAMMLLQLGKGTSTRQAAGTFVNENKLQVVQDQDTQINGFPATVVVSDQISQDQSTGQQKTIRILSHFIQYGGYIYVIHGMALQQDFDRYFELFKNTGSGFNKLTDPSKINVKPERIAIKTVPSNMTLQKALQTFKMPASRFNELAILNGMNINAPVKQGMLIKVVEKK